MSLKLHLTSLSASEQEELAQSCRTTVGHLRNVAYGFRVASPALAMSLEDLTHGAVTRRDLRPKDCHLIWPELAASPEPKAEA